MRKQALGACCLVGVLVSACGGGGNTASLNKQSTLQPLYGSATSGVILTEAGQDFTINFGAVSDSRFLSLRLPPGRIARSWNWVGQTDAALLLGVPDGGGFDIGVVPLRQGQPVSLTLQILIVPGTSEPQSRPSAVAHAAGLLATDAGGGQTALSWTQNIPGDYDFDGVVTVADLQPLAAHWQQPVEHSSPGMTKGLTGWLDGNADGVIDAQDVAVIQRNLGLQVAGYRLRHNSIDLPGQGIGGALVDVLPARTHAGSPATYCVSATGAPGDSWEVMPVDPSGNELGHDFIGGAALTVNVDVVGTNLLPIQPGEIKLDTRIIDPIDLIDSALPLPSIVDGSSVRVSHVPVGRTLVANLEYRPAVGLTASSWPTETSTLTDAGTASLTTTAIAFQIPPDVATLAITADIEMTPNRTGGSLITLRTRSAADDAPPVISTVVLDCQTGQLRRDTNADGSVDDEFTFSDANRDCISDTMFDQIKQRSSLAANAVAMRIRGQVQAIDIVHGKLSLAGVTALDSREGVPSNLDLQFAENTRLGLSAGQPGPALGKLVEASIFSIPNAANRRAYWIDSLHPLTGHCSASKVLAISQASSRAVQLTWPQATGYSGYRLVRYSSPYLASGPGAQFNFGAPNQSLDWSVDLAADILSYSDEALQPGVHCIYDLYGIGAGGNAEFLGMASRWTPAVGH